MPQPKAQFVRRAVAAVYVMLKTASAAPALLEQLRGGA
jgi:hypothetical protein